MKPHKRERYDDQTVSELTIDQLEALIDFYNFEPWEDMDKIIREQL